MKIFIGLGNPGKQYTRTRHNIGFQIIDELQKLWYQKNHFSAWIKNKKFNAEIAEGTIKNEKIILVKPQTFMNESGQSAQTIMSFYKLTPENIIVIHDDIDLLFGEIKIQKNISSAGHNGIKSIINRINSQDFHRIRIGIKQAEKKEKEETVDFVLNNFNLLEKLKLGFIKKEVLEKIEKTLI